ncbi:MAG: hypothetical protein U0641_16245 [Anaerolineae bacterium]
MRAAKLTIWLLFVLGLGVVIMNFEAVRGAPATNAATAYPPPSTPRATPPPSETPGAMRVQLYFPYVSRAPGPPPLAPQARIMSGDTYALAWDRLDGLLANPLAAPSVIAYTAYETYVGPDGPQERELATFLSRSPTESFSVPISPPTAGVNAYHVVARNYLAAVSGNEVKLPAPARFDSQVVDGHGGGYTLRWSAVSGADSYTFEEATSPSSSAVSLSVSLSSATRQYELKPHPLGTYWYRVTAKTADAAVRSEWKAVRTPRPGLWGVVTYKGTPKQGVAVDLMRCTVRASDPRYCDDDVQLDMLSTQVDGSYNFTGIPPTTDPTNPTKQYKLYVEFVNDDDPSYLLEWISEYRQWPQDAGADGTAQASSFDIMNISLVSPAPYALQPLPVTFVWQKRGLTSDSYGLRFSGGDLAAPLYLKSVGYTDSLGPFIDVRPLRLDTEYWWQVWVEVTNQGHGRSYYGRPITFVPRPPASDKDAALESLKSLVSPTLPPFSARSPHLEPGAQSAGLSQGQ